MIDASKSPIPTWRRYGTAVLLTVLIAVAAYVVWAKELHPSAPSEPAAPAASAPVAHRTPPTTRVLPTTTIPGGIPVSSRDPFGN